MDGALSGNLVRLLSEDGQHPLWSLEKWRGLLGALTSTEMPAVTNHNPSRKPSAKVLVKATRIAVCAGEDFSYFQPAPPRQGWVKTGVDLSRQFGNVSCTVDRAKSGDLASPGSHRRYCM